MRASPPETLQECVLVANVIAFLKLMATPTPMRMETEIQTAMAMQTVMRTATLAGTAMAIA